MDLPGLHALSGGGAGAAKIEREFFKKGFVASPEVAERVETIDAMSEKEQSLLFQEVFNEAWALAKKLEIALAKAGYRNPDSYPTFDLTAHSLGSISIVAREIPEADEGAVPPQRLLNVTVHNFDPHPNASEEYPKDWADGVFATPEGALPQKDRETAGARKLEIIKALDTLETLQAVASVIGLD